ncbi:hypothetical protein FA95DRAFT_1562125 [Auriscalpium vulgare]|uniref:Uncharacterized protein n=1 Tax=Auriscalpium vulgare TaxID=40419 RepID=A0ACB8RK73_9AGAM|nr:hypothetical protein FA95DRAFT_1562125 [Auriscalpium vulgare]
MSHYFAEESSLPSSLPQQSDFGGFSGAQLEPTHGTYRTQGQTTLVDCNGLDESISWTDANATQQPVAGSSRLSFSRSGATQLNLRSPTINLAENFPLFQDDPYQPPDTIARWPRTPLSLPPLDITRHGRDLGPMLSPASLADTALAAHPGPSSPRAHAASFSHSYDGHSSLGFPARSEFLHQDSGAATLHSGHATTETASSRRYLSTTLVSSHVSSYRDNVNAACSVGSARPHDLVPSPATGYEPSFHGEAIEQVPPTVTGRRRRRDSSEVPADSVGVVQRGDRATNLPSRDRKRQRMDCSSQTRLENDGPPAVVQRHAGCEPVKAMELPAAVAPAADVLSVAAPVKKGGKPERKRDADKNRDASKQVRDRRNDELRIIRPHLQIPASYTKEAAHVLATERIVSIVEALWPLRAACGIAPSVLHAEAIARGLASVAEKNEKIVLLQEESAAAQAWSSKWEAEYRQLCIKYDEQVSARDSHILVLEARVAQQNLIISAFVPSVSFFNEGTDEVSA